MVKRSVLTALVLVLSVCGLVNAALAAVNLEWRPSASSVTFGDPFEVGLYAVASGSTSELVSSIDVVVVWDPAYLGLVSLPYDPPEMWLLADFSFFAMDGINDELDDGNAQYTGWANFGEPIEVTPEGVLCDWFRFESIAPTAQTTVSIVDSFGLLTYTSVLDGTAGNNDITGSLGSATVAIVPVPEPASLCVLASGVVLALLRRPKRA